MKINFINEKKATYSINMLCDVLGYSRDFYYKHNTRGVSARELEDVVLQDRIHAIWLGSRKTYGVPRVYAVLQAEGVKISAKRVSRLYKQAGCVSKHTKKHKYADLEPQNPAVPNVLERKFTVSAPNTVWATDVTYFQVGNKWAYLVVFIDLYNRKVVGWHVSKNVDTKLCVIGLQKAVALHNPPAGLLIHSDQGSTYTANDFKDSLSGAQMKQSMSRRGNCWDNAVAESFFKTIKTELDRKYWRTTEDLHLDVFSYIEGFYNNHRIHSTLGYLSPNNYGQVENTCVKGGTIEQYEKDTVSV